MLKNKVVIITGGAGLIGKEFVKAVVGNGGVAIIADINEDLGNKSLDLISEELKIKFQISNPKSQLDFVNLDITSKESLNNCIQYVNKKFGKIDALVNNAYPKNKNFGKHFFDVEIEDFNQNLNMNLGGYFLCSQQIAKFFLKQGYGNIINIASIYGVVAPRFEIYANTPMTVAVEYSVIKSGLIHFSKYLAKYLKEKNIRVNCISPGGIKDNQPESFLNAYKEKCLNKGMLESIDICGTLVYLLSDASKFVNGQNIVVDDGFCL